jgi:hypothetical protein
MSTDADFEWLDVCGRGAYGEVRPLFLNLGSAHAAKQFLLTPVQLQEGNGRWEGPATLQYTLP